MHLNRDGHINPSGLGHIRTGQSVSNGIERSWVYFVIYFVLQSMRILLINPPHPAIGSRIPREHLPPLGLLALGGPLLDAGHEVKLLDAEFGPMSLADIITQVVEFEPAAVLLGHSGSTSGHPSAVRIMRVVRQALPWAMDYLRRSVSHLPLGPDPGTGAGGRLCGTK